MRTDAGLQSVHARCRLHLHVAAPFVRYIEIPQRDGRDDQRNGAISDDEGPGLRRKQIQRAGELQPAGAPEPEGACRDRCDEERDQPEYGSRTTLDAQAPQPRAHPAQQARSGKADPKQEQRRAAQVRPETDRGILAGQCEYDSRQFDDEDDRERRARFAKVRKVKRFVAAASGGVRLHASRADGSAFPSRSNSSALRRKVAEMSSSA